jgi:hypothetical protein
MQFRAATASQVRSRQAVQRSSPSYRDCPLDTARDRCFRHAGGTADRRESQCSHLAATAPARRRGRDSPRVTTESWARARRARGSRVGDSNSGPPAEAVPGGCRSTRLRGAADNLGAPDRLWLPRHRDLADLPVAALAVWAIGPADDWDLWRRVQPASRSTALVYRKDPWRACLQAPRRGTRRGMSV